MAQTSITELVFLGFKAWSSHTDSLPGSSFHLGGYNPDRLSALWSGWNWSVTNRLVLSYLQSAWGHQSGMQKWELQPVRFPSPHLCHSPLAPSPGKLAKVPSMEGGNMMLAQYRKSQWRPKAGLGSFVSTLRARNSGQGKGHYKLAPKPYVILSLSSPQAFTQHLGAQSTVLTTL